ncbi:MAG: Na+ dependent nucleoside transporter N-terminal domain-containing protein [Planctomycetota bacterium]
MYIARAMLGLAVFILLAWALSSNRKQFPWRVVFTGLLLQIALGLLVLKTPFGRAAFEWLGDGFLHLLSFPQAASEAVFGNVSNPLVWFGW